MAPRQRVSSPEPPLDESDERPPLLAGSFSSDDHQAPTYPAGKCTVASDQLNHHNSELAREQHDIFNLVALPILIASTLVNWDFNKFLEGYGPIEAWTDRYFGLTFVTVNLYFMIDLIWVTLVPSSVKSPGVIFKHHIVTIIYVFGALPFAEFRWVLGACLVVEANTFFLILRRVLYKRPVPVSPLVMKVVSILFYLSWLIIRCFIYPAILLIFFQLARERIESTNRLWHWPMIFIPAHFVLCLLNLKWSYDLFQPIVKKWLSMDSEGPSVSTGL